MPRKTADDEMSLENYLQLYNMFSPEHTAALATHLSGLRQQQQGEQFAQERGAPNLATLKLGQQQEEHESMQNLRSAALQQRGESADTSHEERLANLALSTGNVDMAKQLLNAAVQRYGLSAQPSAAPEDEKKRKLQALFGQQ